MSRAELGRAPEFAEVSPELGELDEDAFDELLSLDPDTALTLLAAMGSATDEQLRAAARRLASRVVLDLGRRGAPMGRGVGRLHAVPAGDGELDLEASLEPVLLARAAGQAVDPDDLTARAWGRPALALCLLVDASGSMGGERLAAAALTAAACAWRAPGEHAVLSFAGEPVVIRGLDSVRPAGATVEAVLALRGHGTTALAAGLRAASAQLERSRAARRVVLLLSDCRASDREDPVAVARTLSELLILAPAEDTEQAEALARASGARWAPLVGAADAPSALATLLNGA